MSALKLNEYSLGDFCFLLFSVFSKLNKPTYSSFLRRQKKNLAIGFKIKTVGFYLLLSSQFSLKCYLI